ncbi:MAG TPA: CdaR family protein, partial [bacterium]|nr:CdaR family protein [bacterium]
IVAAALAVGLWGIFAATSGVVQRDFLVPVEYSNIPAEMGIERVVPRELTVTLTGDERLFRIFSPEDIKATVDLSMAREGKQRISIRPGAIARVPRNFRINSIRPEEIDITLKRAEK